MCADDEVDISALDIGDYLFLLLVGAEAREHFDVHRKRAHTAHRGLVVLQSQNGRGNEQRDLLARDYRLVGGAQGDLRLAVADVAAEQAVHRARLLHVLLYIVGCIELRRGLLVFKCGFEIALKMIVLGEGKAGAAHTLGVKPYQLLCDILERCLGTCLCLAPLGAAEF